VVLLSAERLASKEFDVVVRNVGPSGRIWWSMALMKLGWTYVEPSVMAAVLLRKLDIVEGGEEEIRKVGSDPEMSQGLGARKSNVKPKSKRNKAIRTSWREEIRVMLPAMVERSMEIFCGCCVHMNEIIVTVLKPRKTWKSGRSWVL
jgi:hypothetical protein